MQQKSQPSLPKWPKRGLLSHAVLFRGRDPFVKNAIPGVGSLLCFYDMSSLFLHLTSFASVDVLLV